MKTVRKRTFESKKCKETGIPDLTNARKRVFYHGATVSKIPLLLDWYLRIANIRKMIEKSKDFQTLFKGASETTTLYGFSIQASGREGIISPQN